MRAYYYKSFRKAGSMIMFLIFCLVFLPALNAQSPQAFKYQAVVRNDQGEPLQNQLIDIKISILKGSETGEIAYSEVHTSTTSEGGLITLNIGEGSQLSGGFSGIDWGESDHFVKIEIDPEPGKTGGYIHMGTSQLLSVPYSLHSDKAGFAEKAGGILFLTSQQLDELENPETGMVIYITDQQNIAIYDGAGWLFFEPCPPLLVANAGGHVDCECVPYNLEDHSPGEGNAAIWEIISPYNPDSAYIFYPTPYDAYLFGQIGATYTLVKKHYNHCDFSTDTLTVGFLKSPTQAITGENQINVNDTIVQLAANTPDYEFESGKWNIESGQGGQFLNDNDTIPEAIFFGLFNETYILSWTITNKCNLSSVDYVSIGFCPLMVQADAGSDILNACIPHVLLGNNPGPGKPAHGQ